jgi:hypothetical protein
MRQGSMNTSAEHDRLLFLVEELQRQGKSEQEINQVLDRAIAERAAARQAS